MSEKLGSLMREATAPLHVVWEEPASLRRRAARMRVRLRIAVGLVSVAALGMGGSVALGPADPPPCAAAVPLPSPPPPDYSEPSTMVFTAVSPPRVRVYHGAIGVASNVADELLKRGFYVEEAARTDESMSYYSAVIRYGPDAVEDAHLVKAQFVPWEVHMEFDPAKRGRVDLLLGDRFQFREVCAQE